MARLISEIGWKWSLDVLNTKADILRSVDWVKFEGTQRRGKDNLKEGIYYGQLLNGKRDGFGIVYTTDFYDHPWLYECEWNEGVPMN